MIENKVNLNQTQFSVEEPILAQPVTIDEQLVTADLPIAKKSRFSKWWWLGGALLLIAIIIIIIIWRMPHDNTPVNEETSPISNEQILSPLGQRLETTKKLLKTADPTVQELSFPPLNLELRID